MEKDGGKQMLNFSEDIFFSQPENEGGKMGKKGGVVVVVERI